MPREPVGRGGKVSLEENKAVVRRYWNEVWNQGRLELIDELFGSDAMVQGQRQFVSKTLAAFSDSHVTLEDEVAEGGRVVVRYEWRARHTGVYDLALGGIPMSLPPTGKDVWDRGIAIFQVVDGRIVGNWAEWTHLQLAQQLGAIPTPEPGAR
jgi:predicted ester cyclase